ncbi:MAG: hypothetical protein K6T35_02360, partial [Meiothermus silvanus]|nr:hypothetical protein [Allomeiothermus silvanus]
GRWVRYTPYQGTALPPEAAVQACPIIHGVPGQPGERRGLWCCAAVCQHRDQAMRPVPRESQASS